MRPLCAGWAFAVSCVALSAVSAQAQDARYSCELGDFGVEVIRAVGTGTVIDPQFLIVLPASSEVVSPEDAGEPFVLPRVAPGLYEGPEGRASLLDLTVTLDDGTELKCAAWPTGGSSPALSPVSPPFVAPGEPVSKGEFFHQPLDVPGRSFGGRLRAAPSIDAEPIGSTAEGAALRVIRRTPDWFQGYHWFEVVTASGQRAFQWGGILCLEGMDVPGAFTCGP